ncbi:hypothetical protein niasHS_009130 [Heterodera schachtii]|uniref:Cadherin domain-containing protein n=2 Tax=Heterodera TaxID=34509 RepID=A0ABD2JEF5_HETSC
MDTVIHSLRQRFRQTRSSSSRSSSRMQQHHQHNNDDDTELEAYTPDLLPSAMSASTSQAPTPLPTTTSNASASGPWQRGGSVKSRNSLKLLKRKIFGGTASKNRENGGGGVVETTISTAPSDENIAWTAPSSPQIGGTFNGVTHMPRRRNSARLRELQRLLRAYHEQRRSGWTSTPSSPRTHQRQQMPMEEEAPSPSAYYDRNFVHQGRDHPIHLIPVAKLSYCRGELGPERPLILQPHSLDQQQQNLPGPNVLRRKINLSELELALLNGANTSCPSSLVVTNSSQIASSPQPLPTSATVVVHTQPPGQTTAEQAATTVVEEKHAYRATNFHQQQQHQQIISSSKHLQYQGATTVTSTTHFSSAVGSPQQQQMDFLIKKPNYQPPIDLPLISPSPYEQIISYVAPPVIMPKPNVQTSSQINIDQRARKDLYEMATAKSNNKQKKKKRRNKTDEMPKTQHLGMDGQYAEIQNQQISGNQMASSPKLSKPQQQQNAKTYPKSGSSNILSLGFHQLVQRHFQQSQLPPKQQQKAVVEPMLKSARSEPRLTARANRREHWLLMSRPEIPGSSFLSPTPSIAALEHLDRVRDRISETKYVTAVFESRGGLGPVLSDVQAELEHWLGDTSLLLAIACEVHWSVPERFRSRQLEIELKQCLHAVLRVNNRRVLSLNDNDNDEETAAVTATVSPADSPFLMPRHGPRHRSFSTHSLNNRSIGGSSSGRPFPIALARSKTEESCIRDAELDAFQGIYRRFYPALLPLQDPATVKAHQGYWTLENLTDEHKAPLVPDPARFLYQPEQPAQLVRKSLVAVNMAVLRMVGDERDYDADDARGKQAKPGLKENELLSIQITNIDDNLPYFPHSLKDNSSKMTILSVEHGFLGKVQAIDEDLAPFNRIFYTILPSSDKTSQISIDQETGEMFAHNLTGLSHPIKFCVFASTFKPNATHLAIISRHGIPENFRSILHLQIVPNPSQIADHHHLPQQMPLGLIRANNSHSLLEHQFLRQQIPIEFDGMALGNGHNNSLSNKANSSETYPKLSFDSIEFVPYGQDDQHQKIGTFDVIRQLVGIDSTNAKLRFNPAFVEAFEDGLYKFGISVQDAIGNKAIVYRNIHLLNDKFRLRFRFNESLHAIGANLTTFIGELEKRLQGDYRIMSSLPIRDEENPAKNFVMCFHLWSPTNNGGGAIVEFSESERLLSTNVQNSKASEQMQNLYSEYKVINIESCAAADSSTSVLLNSDSFGPSMLQPNAKQLLICFTVFAMFVLLSTAFACYICVVRRYAERMRTKCDHLLDEQRSASYNSTDNPYSVYAKSNNKLTPSSMFAMPEFIHPKTLRSDELEY